MSSDLRELPWSCECEQSVLGGLMLDASSFDRINLEAKHFFDTRHAAIFRAIAVLTVANKPVDPITVLDELRKAGAVDEDFGGLQYLNALAQSVPSAANARGYARVVRERHAERALIETADEALEKAQDDKAPYVERLDSILEAFTALQKGTMRREPRRLSDILVERLDHLNDVASGAVPPAWPTGFPDLDRRLGGGLRPGYVYILAARPSVGKSSLAQALGLRMAASDFPVLFLSQEMPDADLGDRAMVMLSRIDYGRLQMGQLQDDEWGRLAEGMDRGAHLPYWVDDQPAMTMRDVRAKARMVKGLKVLMVDYLQLMRSSVKGNRNDQIEDISRGMKELAKELGVAVIEISQLNRAVEGRGDKRPILSDLRDSGAIEQDADVVMLMWRHRQFPDRDIMGCDVAKVRNGRTGLVAFDFQGAIQHWEQSTADLTPDPVVHGGNNL